MSEIYCIKCKNHTGSIKPKVVTTANNRKRLTGKCTVCSTMKSKFIGNKTGETIIGHNEDYPLSKPKKTGGMILGKNDAFMSGIRGTMQPTMGSINVNTQKPKKKPIIQESDDEDDEE